MIHFENRDCMDAMKEFPDNFFDLAIVDPPYGAGFADGDGCKGWFSKYHQDGSQTVQVEREREPITVSAADLTSTRISRGGWHGKQKYHLGTPTREELQKTGRNMGLPELVEHGRGNTQKIIAWDVAPKQEYFNELFRISRNQVIWGGNYFSLPPTRCFLTWRKLTISESFSMAMCEYAWTSFNSNAKWFECAPQDTSRFHPTQKPVKLYQWILEHYAKDGDKILDTHVGSASSLIACDRMGFDAWGYEIDETYFKLAEERIKRELAQGTLF